MLETYASQDPIVIVAAPPAVAASLGEVIRVCCHGLACIAAAAAPRDVGGGRFGGGYTGRGGGEGHHLGRTRS